MSATFVLHGNDPNRIRVIANVQSFIQKLPDDKSFQIDFSAYQKSRTGKQNAGLFAAIYPPLMEFMGMQGERDKEALHEHFCCEFFGSRSNALGVRIPIRTTTRDESGQRDVVDWRTFSEFVAFIQRQGAEYGVYIPDPDPLWREGK